jgi:hypothetical protein
MQEIGKQDFVRNKSASRVGKVGKIAGDVTESKQTDEKIYPLLPLIIASMPMPHR